MKILADNVNTSRGAPMGRHNYTCTLSGESIFTAIENDNGRAAYLETLQSMPLKFQLQDARVSGGYDRGGAYWGDGQRVYLAESIDGRVFRSFRADSRMHAFNQLREEFPHARAYGIAARIDKRDPRYAVQRVRKTLNSQKLVWVWRVKFYGANGTIFLVGEDRRQAEALRQAERYDVKESSGSTMAAKNRAMCPTCLCLLLSDGRCARCETSAAEKLAPREALRQILEYIGGCNAESGGIDSSWVTNTARAGLRTP